MITLHIIIGTTRENRFSEKPAYFIYEEAKKKPGVNAELIDLRDWFLPFFDEPVSPSFNKGEYKNALAAEWAKKVSEADGYIIVTGEYNHGYPAVLKNALDYVYKEWNNKAVGFVSYGSAGGARSVEQLRQVAVELRMVPIRSALHIPWDLYMSIMKEKTPVDPELFRPLREGYVDRVDAFLQDLIWTVTALQTAREQERT